MVAEHQFAWQVMSHKFRNIQAWSSFWCVLIGYGTVYILKWGTHGTHGGQPSESLVQTAFWKNLCLRDIYISMPQMIKSMADFPKRNDIMWSWSWELQHDFLIILSEDIISVSPCTYHTHKRDTWCTCTCTDHGMCLHLFHVVCICSCGGGLRAHAHAARVW